MATGTQVRKALRLLLGVLLLAAPVSAQVLGSGNIAVNGASVSVPMAGVPSISIQVAGTWSGTLSFFSAPAGGSCSNALLVSNSATGATATTTTGNGVWTVPNGGFLTVCVTATAWSSGTAGVTITQGFGGAGGSGGGSSSSVTINDPSVTTQKAAVNASGQLSITCANCSGSGASAVDEAAFTLGSGSFAPAGGFFQTTATSNALTTGQGGLVQMTANRAFHINLRNASGTELGVAAAPLQVSLANTAANATAVKVDNSAVTQPISVASGGIASGGIASGAIASGAIASGAVASGAFASDSGSFGVGSTGSAVPAKAIYLGATNGGTLTGLPGDSTNGLWVNIKAGAGSGGTALADEAAFTQGSTNITPIGCLFINSYTGITTGHAGVASCTTGGALNVSVTNANANGSATSANSSPVVIASDQAAVAVKAASGSIASGAIASGAVASGAFASGSIGSGAIASGAIASGAAAAGAFDSDSLAFGVGSTGAAVPAKSSYIGGNGSGNLTGFIACDSSIVYDASTNGKTQLVALSSGKVTYVCGVSITQSTTSAVTVSLGSGTGTNCGTTYTAKTPAWPIQGPTSVGPTGLVLPLAMMPWFKTAASEELCISTNAGVSVQAIVSYTQF